MFRKIPSTSEPVKNINENTNIEIQNKIPDTSGLVNNAMLNKKLTEVENKTPTLRSLVEPPPPTCVSAY